MKLAVVATILAVLLVAPAQAFAPRGLPATSAKRFSALKMSDESSYWEGEAPPSSVLGPILSKTPSALLAPLSLASLAVGTYCVHASNIFNTLSVSTIYPSYIVGSLLCPIAWGLHVACWINQKNGN